jgi:hypothetical protein
MEIEIQTMSKIKYEMLFSVILFEANKEDVKQN